MCQWYKMVWNLFVMYYYRCHHTVIQRHTTPEYFQIRLAKPISTDKKNQKVSFIPNTHKKIEREENICAQKSN